MSNLLSRAQYRKLCASPTGGPEVDMTRGCVLREDRGVSSQAVSDCPTRRYRAVAGPQSCWNRRSAWSRRASLLGDGFAQQTHDFSGLGVAFLSLLGEYATSVELNLEHPARRLDQPHLHLREGGTNLGRQTGGPRLIVSNDAEFYCDAHSPTIAVLDMPRHTSELARIA